MNKQKAKERKMRKTRSQKGITLIALIITIIVLLILAVVAIQAVTGDGIIFHAENATTEYGMASEKESIQLAVMSAKKYIPNVSIDTAELESQLGKVDGITITKGTDKWTVTSAKTGLVYEINLSTGNTLSDNAASVAVDAAPGTLEEVATNTYEINSIEDLVALAYNVNSKTNTYSGKTVTLGRNLYFDGSFNSYANPDATYELDGSLGYKTSTTSETTIKSLLTSTDGIGFVPIGLNPGTGMYEGDFDGNGNFIDGMYIYENENHNAGFFSWICSTVTINNLGITNGNILSDEHCAAGIVGRAEISDGQTVTIENCYFTGSIVAPCVAGVVYSSASPNSNGVIIKNCFNGGTISATGSEYAGGIVGKTVGTKIVNCYNTGKISSTGAPCGGIVGCMESGTLNIEGCYNKGNIVTNFPTGGIIGYMKEGSLKVDSCYNEKDISTTSAPVGGILGMRLNSTICEISNCYNSGDISSGANSGGIVGCGGNTTILNCYNIGDISGTRSAPAGGICSINGAGIIRNCFNSGNIVSSSQPGGGILGHDSTTGTTVTNCFNIGNVSVTSAPAGGIISGGSVTTTTCYSTGTITSGINMAGDIYGYGSPTVTDCGERTISDFLTIFNNYVTTNNSNSANTQLRQWQLADGKLIFSL